MNGNGVNKDEVRALLKERRFGDLFRKLGWDSDRLDDPLQLQVNNNDFTVTPVAEKRDFVAFICEDDDNRLARRVDRRELTKKLARYNYEHLLIICGKNSQRWMVTIRPKDHPVQLLEAEWHHHQDIALLANQLEGLFFHISGEDGLTLTDVVEQVRSAFAKNAETVTRKFYGEFQKELRDFAKFIKGVSDRVKREWYAALMLNRLMFIYFLQKRKFLDGDADYLSVKLRETQKKYGKDKFNRTFYRRFLRRLFAEGLGAPESARDADLQKMIGKVPYLNGGLFDPHSIEQEYTDIDIPDRAFANLFAFFNKYKWHLDTRPQAGGNEINPDVIGYIFERYINNRADMGAYYTQEDVTGYIARNTIIPFLLERARKECANAFEPQNGIWRFLRDHPENFVYDAVKKGCNIRDGELPENIRRGISAKTANLRERRKDWNKPADDRFALPTETWRETVTRRIRCHELFSKMKSGDIRSAEDLITHNLDIERFVAVALESYEGTDFLEAFFAAIAGKKPRNSKEKGKRGITVLDPACGSGAFLFAALNVLEPLYETCVERMRVFVDEDNLLRKQGKRKGQRKHQQFRKTLADIAKHPNPRYWIYKQIILHNLFGVDLMPEAAEIAKLRLFLKLAAAAGEADRAKDNLGLEPLPDIDFNIRGGNALVGFTSARQFDDFAKSSLLDKKEADDIREQMKTTAQADIRFRQSQENNSPEDYKAAKRELGARLEKLNDSLSRYLAIQHGKSFRGYDKWLASHRPLHWLSEFYDIVENSGGFDVIIGNPPYIEYSKVKKEYTVLECPTRECGNLYAMFIEKAFLLGKGPIGMIVQLPLVCTDRMAPARALFTNNNRAAWFSNYDDRPGKLFAEIAHARASIFLSMPSTGGGTWSTRYQRWLTETRANLFPQVAYQKIISTMDGGLFPKIGDKIGSRVFTRLTSMPVTVAQIKAGDNLCHYHKAPQYWMRVTDFIPYFCSERDGIKQSSAISDLCFATRQDADAVCVLLNSSLFYWWFIARSDCRNFNLREIENFPFSLGKLPKAARAKISALVRELMVDYRKNAARKTILSNTSGKVEFDEFFVRKSKHIIDKIDAVLARHYGLTDEELDYIINYDIKYRTSQN